MVNKTRTLISILILVIILLLAVIAYAFLIKPSYTGYVVGKQSEGYEFAIVSIMQRASTCQPVPLVYNNQTITLIAVECLQQAQEQAAAQASP
jgi:hypothetical protein